jgi:hypothetical protein
LGARSGAGQERKPEGVHALLSVVLGEQMPRRRPRASGSTPSTSTCPPDHNVQGLTSRARQRDAYASKR